MKIKDPQLARKAYLQRTYAITPEEYDAILQFQGNACAICGRPQSTSKKRLAVDHSHKTGLVRMLLCGQCNQGLRWFWDNPKSLQKAAECLLDPPAVRALGEARIAPKRKKRRKKRTNKPTKLKLAA